MTRSSCRGRAARSRTWLSTLDAAGSCGALQVPGCARALLAQRAAPLPPQPLRVVVGKQLRRPAGAAGGLAVAAQQQRKEAFDLKERPIGGPTEAAVRPVVAVVSGPQGREDPTHLRDPPSQDRQRCGGRIVVTVTAREPASEGEADTEGEAVPRHGYPAARFPNVMAGSLSGHGRQRAIEGDRPSAARRPSRVTQAAASRAPDPAVPGSDRLSLIGGESDILLLRSLPGGMRRVADV